MPFSLVKNIGQIAADLLAPPFCAGCRVRLVEGYLCESCQRLPRRVHRPFCECCSHPFDGEIDATFRCPNCLDRTMHFECAAAAFQAVGLVRRLIHAFKYHHREYLRRPLADWLIESLADSRLTATPIDGLVPVPLHPRRQRERGYNQALLITELVADDLHFPLLDVLQRRRYTTTQTSFDRSERMENLQDAFVVSDITGVQNKNLVLVDDVLTTGSTLNECARVLRLAGAASVRAVCIARG